MSLFEFEKDFAGSLRCIPMITRQKLDLVGIKLSLRQWSRLSHAERDQLVTLRCADGPEQDAYRRILLDMLARRPEEPVVMLGEISHQDWMRDDHMPDQVIGQARTDGIDPPRPADWARLSPLQRFALVKLARSKHENENFMPAMLEFGLGSATS